MQFSYVKVAGENPLSLNIKEYAHIFKVRRIKSGAILKLRNLEDEYIYEYSIKDINKKEARLELVKRYIKQKNSKRYIHIGWCVVEPKTVEKTIAMLNEMGVEKISFVYADFSQKNFKFDEARLQRILINSCEQCGRDDLMKVEFIKSVQDFLNRYPQTTIIDFSDKELSENEEIKSFLVGPEGGFSDEEREVFKNYAVRGLQTPYILRSETGVVGVCAKLLL